MTVGVNSMYKKIMLFLFISSAYICASDNDQPPLIKPPIVQKSTITFSTKWTQFWAYLNSIKTIEHSKLQAYMGDSTHEFYMPFTLSDID